MKKGKVYMVHWIDTFVPSDNGWQDIADIKAQAKYHSKNLHSVGFYIGYYHGYEVFAAEFNDKTDKLPWAALSFIPKGCIKEIEKLV